MNSRPPIYFVRHGETDWNKQGLIQGWIDTPLNERGHFQAREIASLLAALPGISQFDFIVSPLTRAKQTISYILAALDLPDHRVKEDAAVKELGFGIWEGKPFWELKASPVYPADDDGRYAWRPEGGESYADGNERISAWLAGIDRPTVVVAHGAIGRCLIGHVAGLDPASTVGLRTPQGCYCRLQDKNADWFDAQGGAA
ncbi:MAG: histidine phosphatase family protein [Rhizobiales bacterium]|nr:histidine phosphatase family protein [Hyphomicrobiales bacterium]